MEISDTFISKGFPNKESLILADEIKEKASELESLIKKIEVCGENLSILEAARTGLEIVVMCSVKAVSRQPREDI